MDSAEKNPITKEEIAELMETVRNLYRSDDIPWVVGYSGGKDSTAALQLVWLALRASEVGHEHDGSSVFDQVIDSRKSSSDPGVISYRTVFERNVEVTSHYSSLAFPVYVFNCLFHKSSPKLYKWLFIKSIHTYHRLRKIDVQVSDPKKNAVRVCTA